MSLSSPTSDGAHSALVNVGHRRLAVALAKEPRHVADLPAWLRGRSGKVADAYQPWWPRAAVALVGSRLDPTSLVFEYGSGGSTHWLALRASSVVSVEHDRDWYERVAPDLPPSVTLLLREPDPEGPAVSEHGPGAFDRYVGAIRDYPDASFDLVVVDGRARVHCGLAAVPKVRPGGMLLLDDSQRAHYAPLVEALAGWQRVDRRGLKPKETQISQTTVWTKPASAVLPTQRR
jgi:hypothetical protein